MRKVVDRYEDFLGAIDNLVKWVVVLALLLMTGVLFLNSIGRSTLNISFVGGPALGRLLVIWLTFFGAYLAVRSGRHITVDVLQRLLSPLTLRKLSIPIGLFSAMTTAYITWLGTIFTWTRFSAGQLDPMLEIPSGFFYLPVPLGGFLMTLAFLQIVLKCILDVRDNNVPSRESGSRDI